MKTKKFSISVYLFFFFIGIKALAQPYVGTTVTYEDSNVKAYIQNGWGSASWHLSGPAGAINTINTGGSGSSAIISWQTPGTYTLKCIYSGKTFWSTTVPVSNMTAWMNTITVGYCPIITPPPTPIALGSGCGGSQTLSFNGSPPSGVTWYWQGTNSVGTSTSNSSSTYTATLFGPNNYYLRAYSSGGCWSDAVSVSATVSPTAQTPYATLEVSTNLCGAKTVTIRTGTLPANEVWYWQETNPSGTTITSGIYSNSTNYRNVTATGTYYLRSLYMTSGCWSPSSQSIYVTVNNVPPDPSIPTTSNNSCGNQTLSFNGSPPSGVTWYWQGTNSAGTSQANSSSTYIASVAGANNYYLRAFSGGCWSNSVSVNATVASPAHTPDAVISLSTNTCGNKTISISGTSAYPGEVWHWQGIENVDYPFGRTRTIDPVGSSATRYASTAGNYYLRSYNITSNCWSDDAQLVTVTTVNTLPNAPASVSDPGLVPYNTSTTLSATGASTNEEYRWYTSNADSDNTPKYAGLSVSSESLRGATSITYYVGKINRVTLCQTRAADRKPQTITLYVPVPTQPSIVGTTSCTNRQLQYSNAPNGATTYVAWYWQGATSGANSIASPINASDLRTVGAGTYYVKAKAYDLDFWSTEVATTVSIPALPTAPAVTRPMVLFNATVSLASYVSGAGVGESYTWYDSRDSNAQISPSVGPLDARTPYVYYVGKTNGICETANDQRAELSIDLYLAAPAPAKVTINTCGPKQISIENGEPNVTYYLQTRADGIDTDKPLSSTPTPYIGTTGSYFVRAKANTIDLWSPAVAIAKANSIVNPTAVVVNSYEVSSSTLQSTQSITLSPGFYVPSGSTFTARVAITEECNNYMNWTESVVYNENAVPIANSRTYYDGFGQALQTQSKNFAANSVLANQTLFDTYNQPAASTLAAPILEKDFISKRDLAVNASNNPYSAADFDVRTSTGAPGELKTPNPFGTAPGTIGWYYSSANNLEKLTPTTQYPYARSFSQEGPDPTSSISAGPGDQHRMGSGHETMSDRYNITNELTHYYGLRAANTNAFGTFPTPTLAILGYFYVATDPDGKRTASFVDADGRSVASALITAGSNPTSFTYDYWSYTYYNDLGQVLATIAPKGVDRTSTAMPGFVTYYKYDHLGQLIETTSPDEGTSRFVYSIDGKIRFSQNQEQANATTKRFSYTNYDYLGRLVESGEYTRHRAQTPLYSNLPPLCSLLPLAF